MSDPTIDGYCDLMAAMIDKARADLHSKVTLDRLDAEGFFAENPRIPKTPPRKFRMKEAQQWGVKTERIGGALWIDVDSMRRYLDHYDRRNRR